MILSGLVVGGCITAGFMLMFPRRAIRRMAGYMVPSDAALSSYGVAQGAATGTVSGMLGGFIGAIGLSIALRIRSKFTGAERLSVNGDDSIRAVAAAGLSQATWWVRSTIASLFKSGAVVPPPAVKWEWIEVAPPSVPFDSLFERMRDRFQDAVYA